MGIDEPDALHRTCTNRSRTPFDVGPYVYRYWHLASGQFSPVSRASWGKYLSISHPMDHIETTLNDSKVKMVCVNDTSWQVHFEKTMSQIVAAYEKKLPNKSAFEK